MLKKLEDKLEELREEGYDFQLSHYFNKAWEIFTQDTGMMVLYTVLLLFGLGIISLIPIIGGLIRILFQTPLLMGYAYVSYRIYHNQGFEFSNFFDGIKDFAKIFVINLLTGMIVAAAIIPFFIFIFYKLTNGFDFQSFGNPNLMFDTYTPMMWVQIIIISFILMIPAIYLGLCFQFSAFLVVFASMDFGKAIKWSWIIVNKKIFHFILMSFLLGFVLMISILPVGLGLFISIPFLFIIKYVMFHEILDFGTLQHDNRDEIQDYLSEGNNEGY